MNRVLPYPSVEVFTNGMESVKQICLGITNAAFGGPNTVNFFLVGNDEQPSLLVITNDIVYV